MSRTKRRHGLSDDAIAAVRSASAAAIGADQPVLYIEFRKNDTILDPQPWWAKSNLEKARG